MIALVGIVIFGVLIYAYGGAMLTGFFAMIFSWMVTLFLLAITLLTFFFTFLMTLLTFFLAIFI